MAKKRPPDPHPTVIDLAKARELRRAKLAKTLTTVDAAMAKVEALPVTERADVIIAVFSMVVAMFSRMVLDHTTPPPRGRRHLTKMRRRSDAMIETLKPKGK